MLVHIYERGADKLQARPYTHTNTYDENAVMAALFLEVLIVLLIFVISLILLLKCASPPCSCAAFITQHCITSQRPTP